MGYKKSEVYKSECSLLKANIERIALRNCLPREGCAINRSDKDHGATKKRGNTIFGTSQMCGLAFSELIRHVGHSVYKIGY